MKVKKQSARTLMLILASVAFSGVPQLCLAERIKGRGQEATRQIKLDAGLAVIALHHSGSNHFAVWLLDSQGNQIDLLANVLGTFEGSRAVGLERAGSYLFDVSADGQWEIVIDQDPPKTRGNSMKGTSSHATPLFECRAGLKVFEFSHEGEGHFAIWLLDEWGRKIELITNNIGPYKGSKAVQLAEGYYLLDIQAAGPWAVRF